MGKGAGSVCGTNKPPKEDPEPTTSTAVADKAAATVPPPEKVAEKVAETAKAGAVAAVEAAVEGATAAVAPVPAEAGAPPAELPTEVAAAVSSASSKSKIYIIYYSLYGHCEKMARAVKEGVDSVDGAEGVLYQVQETLPAEVLEKMYAPPKPSDVPVLDVHTIDQADGFVLGFPSRFGMLPAQMKAFLDATGQHWQKGALLGKPVGLFVSSATQGGGQETTILTAVTQLAQHGMIYVPMGYAAGSEMFDVETVHGGSPYGPGTIAGPTGARQPSPVELEQAKLQGKRVSEIAKKLKA